MMINKIVNLLVPPLLVQIFRSLRGGVSTVGYGLSGDYRSWDEAARASTGYDSERILEKTMIALLKVKSGEAAYERDSVLFDEIQYAWPLLAGLMWVAARCGGTLNVLDFGGSLGSTYFQNRAFLSALPGVRWNIVEQSRHVEIGKAWFEDDRLRFYADITDCLADTQPNVVILSSVLQYLERPYIVFDQILGLPCDHIIIDRTPFWSGPTDRLCVQAVPPNIYPASYPSWIFSRQRFHDHLHEDWQNMVTFDNPDRLAGPVEFIYQGMIIARSNQVS
ncbi:MAG: methyltransferase, TIGR04325 family [Anaerolineae bacterium]